MREVIVSAYPKSGVTWLMHLICDLLEGQHQDTQQMEPLSYDHPVTSNWIVRKVHKPWWGDDIDYLTGKAVIFSQRDPRDVVVSAMCYRGTIDLKQAIGVMVQSHYVDYLESILNPIESLAVERMIITRYEWLHCGADNRGQIAHLAGIVNELTGEWLPDDRIQLALGRQSFFNMRRQLDGDTHFMRKGVVGDWRNHFDRETALMFNIHFGQFMLEQGYVDNLDWWRDFK